MVLIQRFNLVDEFIDCPSVECQKQIPFYEDPSVWPFIVGFLGFFIVFVLFDTLIDYMLGYSWKAAIVNRMRLLCQRGPAFVEMPQEQNEQNPGNNPNDQGNPLRRVIRYKTI